MFVIILRSPSSFIKPLELNVSNPTIGIAIRRLELGLHQIDSKSHFNGNLYATDTHEKVS